MRPWRMLSREIHKEGVIKKGVLLFRLDIEGKDRLCKD